MTAALVVLALCLATSATIMVLARRLLERSRPAIVVPLLAIGSLFNSASLAVLLTLLGTAMLGRVPDVAMAAGWSVDRLETALPVPAFVGLSAAVAAGVVLVRTAWRAYRIVVSFLRSDQLSRRLRAGGAPIVIMDADESQADAYTLAGVSGCVVISRQLFDLLGPVERRLLTGHELSHLRRRHHLYLHAVDLAVAANPTMFRMADAVRLGVERWADEDAVAMLTGDREAAAAALANTALTRARIRRRGSSGQPTTELAVPALGVAGSHVTVRTRALLAPAPRQSALAVALAALLIVTCVAALASALQLHHGFEYAEVLRHALIR